MLEGTNQRLLKKEKKWNQMHIGPVLVTVLEFLKYFNLCLLGILFKSVFSFF